MLSQSFTGRDAETATVSTLREEEANEVINVSNLIQENKKLKKEMSQLKKENIELKIKLKKPELERLITTNKDKLNKNE